MKRPVIGVTSALNERETYQTICRAFMNLLCDCGALPVLLPITADEEILADYVERLDGFLFTGGADVDPLIYGQYTRPWCGDITPDRDAHEIRLARMLLKRRDKPVLGVCRGIQVMNVALGGSVYQDLEKEKEGDVMAHRQKQPEQYPAHSVELTPASQLRRIVGRDTMMVNSLHHQAVNRLGEGLTATAFAPDGVIEAVEMADHPFCVGVQWHPERLWPGDLHSEMIFCAFVNACRGE